MIDTQSKHKSIRIGHRVVVQDHVGTVKYIGEVEGQKGIWLGLDWDDTNRGKHDGTINGKHYFTASSPTSGSFLRPEKVSTGISLMESITSRYGYQENEREIQSNQSILIKVEHECNMPFLRCIGFDGITSKQSNYKALTVLNARMKYVSHLGDAHQFSMMCPNVEEFDVSKNLLHAWEDVFILASELKHLHNLNVSENKLEMPDDITGFKIPNLKTLICGSMGLTWLEIVKLAQVFPNLETLIAPNNRINSFESSQPSEVLFHQLKELDIENNTVSEWSEVMKLKSLPCLETLNLSNSQISQIRIEDNNAFKSLNVLNLKDNQIGNLESLSSLNRLPCVTSLGLLRNPIFEMDAHLMVNQIIIAMICGLRRLNGSSIEDERKGAEIDYMKKFGLEWLQVQGDEQARSKFLGVHTRYMELIRRHGEVEEGELKAEAKTIKESLIELHLAYEGKEVTKRVPPTLQVQKLVTLCQRLFRLPSPPTLVYLSEEQPNIEFDLDESREIGLYSVQTGDKIVVKC